MTYDLKSRNRNKEREKKREIKRLWKIGKNKL